MIRRFKSIKLCRKKQWEPHSCLYKIWID